MRMRVYGLWTLLFLGLGSSCDDPKLTKMTYMPDMADTPAIKPQRDYLDPPEGAVATHSPYYGKSSTEAENLLFNSLVGAPGEDFHLKKGEKLFNIFCAVCHGADLKGKGTMTDKLPSPRDLTNSGDKARKDGFYLHTMALGSTSGLMPGYGHSTTLEEREQILLYVRALQNQAHP